MKVVMIHPQKLGESDNKNYEKSGEGTPLTDQGKELHFVGKKNKCRLRNGDLKDLGIILN